MAAPRGAGRGSPALGAVREGGFEEGRWQVGGGGGGGRGGRAISTATAMQEARVRLRRAGVQAARLDSREFRTYREVPGQPASGEKKRNKSLCCVMDGKGG